MEITCPCCGVDILYEQVDIQLGGDYLSGQAAPFIICPCCKNEITIGYALW